MLYPVMDVLGLLHPFLLSVIPILVAVDAPGSLPLFVGMTEEMADAERQKTVRQSILTAFLVTIGFVVLGQAVFAALGIKVEDFMIAGGVLLLVIAITDILTAGERRKTPGATFGVVPLGTPLIAGPATLTTTLVLVGQYGYVPVIVSLIVNILLAWLIFAQAGRIIRLIGINGSRALAKVASLLLAAIAVKLIRSGIMELVRQ